VTDRIVVSGMRFFGKHGVYTEETRLGQAFHVDLEMYLDLSAAGKHDDLSGTVDYGKAYATVKAIVEGPPLKLLEAIAERIATAVLMSLPVEEVVVRVHKPGAPLPGPFDTVTVEIRRKRTP